MSQTECGSGDRPRHAEQGASSGRANHGGPTISPCFLLTVDQRDVQGAGSADYLFWCPGCKCAHGVWVSPNGCAGVRWGFNGNVERPTFEPSILVRWGDVRGDQVCHSFVTDGRIQFLADCTHELRNQTVDMVDWDSLS